MPLVFRQIDLTKDRLNVQQITASSGFFEPLEVELALEYFDQCAREGEKAEHQFLFADYAGQTVGYSNFGKASYSGISYYLHWIAVSQAYRGKGFGMNILHKTEEIISALGGRKVIIETSSKPQYVPTQSFYSKAGYTLEAAIKDFYLIGDDQLIFTKVIK